MNAGQNGQDADEIPLRNGTYRPVTHWDRPAIVSVGGKHYPCRLVGTVVGRYGSESDSCDRGDRMWAAEALGLPPELEGEVTLVVSGTSPITAQINSGRMAGIGVPWLSDGETLVDDDIS